MAPSNHEELKFIKGKLINLLLTILVFVSGGFYFTGINSFVSKCLDTQEINQRVAFLDNIIVEK
ncbi:MAG: hypothetical protein WCJ57_02570 [Candidatus Falkowbacteria bacterium]